jgi:hypothetical protein
MVRTRPLVALMIAQLLLAACGGGSSPADAGAKAPDAGAQGAADAGRVPDAGLKALSISAVSVRLAQLPTNGDGAINGAIGVLRNGAFVDTATVTANGAAVPLHASVIGGFYDLSKASLASVTPGAGTTLTIVATDGADRAELVVTCPTAVTFTSPVAGAALPIGAFTATWTGKLDYNAGGTKSEISLLEYDSATQSSNGFINGTNTSKTLDGDPTSAQLTNPGGSLPGYLLQMYTEGVAVNGPDGLGKCATQFRIALVK